MQNPTATVTLHGFEDVLYTVVADEDIEMEYELQVEAIGDEDLDIKDFDIEDFDMEDIDKDETDLTVKDKVLAPDPLTEASPSAELTNPIVITVRREVGQTEEDEVIVEELYIPDEHNWFAPAPDDQPLPPRTAASRRRRTRGAARISTCGRLRTRGNHGNRASDGAYSWKRGESLIEVCITDDDVPPALRLMIEDLVRTRAERQAAEQRRRERRQERERKCRRMEDDKEDEDEEEDFYDADDSQDLALLRSKDDQQFHWSPMESFRGHRETFAPERTGSVTRHSDIYGAFRSFWDDTILNDIVTETNRYASSVTTAHFKRDWYDTNIHEILVLFAFWMMLGIVKMPTLKSCFTLNPLLKTEVFRAMFTSKRYEHLDRALHFCNNEAKPLNASSLYCFGRVLEHLNAKFQENYVPNQNICIDESFTLLKGLLFIKRFIPTKVAKFGVKTFELCDSATGYLWSFIVYTGTDRNEESASDWAIVNSTRVVIKLIKPLLHKGYTLFMDNWFNSPMLARYLKQNGTDCVGTLRSARQGVPPLLSLAHLQEGQIIGRHAGDVSVQTWQDKKKMMTISTYHGIEQECVTTGKDTNGSDVWKPRVILDFNKYMGGVDRKDQMLEPYLMERKQSKKWYMKPFKRLLNCSIHNSRILLESSNGKSEDNLACRLRLVDSILTEHLPKLPRPHSLQDRNAEPPFSRLDTRQVHWPVLIGPNASNSREPRNARKHCNVCIRKGLKNIRTTFMCEHCKVALCIINCFKQFHV